MNTTSNLIVADCGVDNSVKAIISKYGIDERHIKHIINTDTGKLHIIEEAEVYQDAVSQQEAKEYQSDYYEFDENKWLYVRSHGTLVEYYQPANYWKSERMKYYYNKIREYNNANLTITNNDTLDEKLKNAYMKHLETYKIDNKYIPFIERNKFVMMVWLYNNTLYEDLVLPTIDGELTSILGTPNQWVKSRYEFIVKQEAEKKQNAEWEERNRLSVASAQEYLAKEAQEDREYKALATKKLYTVDGLLIQRQIKSNSFLLPNENNAKITAYGVIERLTGAAFKSYRQQEKFTNDKIQLLPHSERYRIVFDFRQQHNAPPILPNVDKIAAFINYAIKYTNNWQLAQQWYACIEATTAHDEAAASLLNTENKQAAAASLFVYYGWAADYDKEYPRTENAFYTVDVRSGRRDYNIVDDDITLRFAAIEREGRGVVAREIIADKALQYDDKDNRLQALLKPLLWWNNGVRMGLTTETRLQCDARINEYIDNLLSYNAFDNISLEEHINNIEIDKSYTGIEWTTPQAFTISIEDMIFDDYKYNINADYNKDNAAMLGEARSRKAAQRKFEDITGDKWTTAELNELGFDSNRITRLVKNKVIRRVKRGFYERIKD